NLMMGPVIDIKGKRDLTKVAIENATQINIAEIKLKKTLLLGSNTASTKVYILTDPSCPACAKLHTVLKQIVKKHSNIAFHIILFPLKGMKDSYARAKSINCTSSLKMLEDSLEGKPIPPAACSSKDVDDNMAFGAKNGISMTPTIIFQNGKVHFGAENVKNLLSLINANL
ncbi:MAG: DsbC family protein, partial [Desulfuromonadales bacterium]